MYLRPSQLCRIKVSDVVFPVARLRKGHQKLVVALHPFEGGEPSKTKEFDETMMLDLNHHQFLVPLLQRMVLDRHLNPQDLLFQLTPSTLREWMQDMQVQCQLQQLGPLHPYRLRHGGGINRLLGRTPRSGRHSEARSMANNNVSPPIRKRRPDRTAVVQAPRRHSGASRLGSRQHRQGLCQPAFTLASKLTSPIFLELFSGSGNLSKSVSDIAGWDCGLVDFLLESEHDLRSNLTRNKGGFVLETLGLFIWALHTIHFHVQEIADRVLHHSIQITNPWDLAIWVGKMRSRLERAIYSCGFLFKFACYAICSTFLSLWRIRPRHGFGFALLFWRCCERRVSGMLMLIFVLLANLGGRELVLFILASNLIIYNLMFAKGPRGVFVPSQSSRTFH